MGEDVRDRRRFVGQKKGLCLVARYEIRCYYDMRVGGIPPDWRHYGAQVGRNLSAPVRLGHGKNRGIGGPLMDRIRIGQPLVRGVHGYEEGVHYNYTRGGHDLRMVVKEPHRSVVDAIQKQPAWFALVRREAAVFILSRFGSLPWKVAHYNWWINPPLMRPDPWSDLMRLNGSGLSASVCLVDATDGIVAALRSVRLSLELSRLFIQMVEIQTRPPFDPWRYLEVVEQTCSEGFEPETLLREAACLCVVDLPHWHLSGGALPVTIQ